MKKIEQNVVLRKLVADDNKVLISKELNEFGNPAIVTKELYLAKEANEDEFIEINEEDLILNQEE